MKSLQLALSPGAGGEGWERGITLHPSPRLRRAIIRSLPHQSLLPCPPSHRGRHGRSHSASLPASPVSEKVRVALGLKRLAWRSVEIPRVPPKPDVMPLTGGYRRTPIMQIGADISAIASAFARAPAPLSPADLVSRRRRRSGLGHQPLDGRDVRPHCQADHRRQSGQAAEAFVRIARVYSRARLRCKEVAARASARRRAIARPVRWMDQRLAGGRAFMLGDQPGLPDVVCYYLVWFVRGRWPGGPALFAEFAALESWEQRVKAIGHGQPSEMTRRKQLKSRARTSRPRQSSRPTQSSGHQAGRQRYGDA